MFETRAILAAFYLLGSFSLGGFVHLAWMRSSAAKAYTRPIDGGRALGSKRILGDNKTWAGLMALPPAVGVLFFTASWTGLAPELAGWASRTPWLHGLLGAWGGLGFMLGELPNSFVKRRLGVAPGAEARGGWRRVCAVVDRVDSLLGLLLALALVVPVPLGTWVAMLVVGPWVHYLFSYLLHRLGVKARAA